MYKFDFDRITPLEWATYGYYFAIAPDYIIVWLAFKAALFDYMTLPYEEMAPMIADFDKQLTEYQNKYIVNPPIPPTTAVSMPEPGTDFSSLFWRAVRGE